MIFLQAKKVQTHISTNLSSSQIENFHGNQVCSRLREMINLIGCERNIMDKRV